MNKTINKVIEKIGKFYDHPLMKRAKPYLMLMIGMSIGTALTNRRYDGILSDCQINVWDAWENDLKTEEFFDIISKENRIAPKCPTQIFIN